MFQDKALLLKSRLQKEIKSWKHFRLFKLRAINSKKKSSDLFANFKLNKTN